MSTDAERKLWWHLRRIPIAGTHFRRQATIGRYFVDFASHQTKLVIKLDGAQHGERDQRFADARRTEFLNSRGYRVLRFWNNEVFENMDGVLTVIYAAMSEPPTPNPTPPQAGGGESNRYARHWPRPARDGVASSDVPAGSPASSCRAVSTGKE